MTVSDALVVRVPPEAAAVASRVGADSSARVGQFFPNIQNLMVQESAVHRQYLMWATRSSFRNGVLRLCQPRYCAMMLNIVFPIVSRRDHKVSQAPQEKLVEVGVPLTIVDSNHWTT